MQEAAAPHLLSDRQQAQQQQGLDAQLSWDGSVQEQRAVEGDDVEEETFLGLELHDNPSFVANGSSGIEALSSSPPHMVAATVGGGEHAASAAGPATTGDESRLMNSAAAATDDEGLWRVPGAVGLILLHPGMHLLCMRLTLPKLIIWQTVHWHEGHRSANPVYCTAVQI